MRTIQLIIWFSVFISLYAGVNFYILLRLRQALPASTSAGKIMTGIFIFLALSYWAGRIIEIFSVCLLSDILFWIGSFWFGAMLYFFMSVVIIDFIRVSDHYIKFFPALIRDNMVRVKIAALISVIAVTSAALTAGYIQAIRPVITEKNFVIKKHGGQKGKVTIALVTDIHMGTIVKNAHLEKMNALIREINPDLVFLGGDIFDEDLKPVIKHDLGNILLEISGKYPTYAITGNHEYYGGIDEAVGYLDRHAVILLRDRAVKIGNLFYILGRDDRTKNDFEKEPRKSISELVKGADKNFPIILMDHNPMGIKEAAAEGIDLMLSGHTHRGQLWPMNYITSLIYPVDSGEGKIENTLIYVSTGFGTWGPPVRLGSRPEVVKIVVSFE